MFNIGDILIWDSGFGTELVRYIKEGSNIHNTSLCKVLTGKMKGTKIPFPTNELRLLKNKYDSNNRNITKV